MSDTTQQDELAAILYKTLLEKIQDHQETIEFLENSLDTARRQWLSELEEAADRAERYRNELNNAEQEILSLDRKIAELEDKLVQISTKYNGFVAKTVLGKSDQDDDQGHQAWLAKANNERERALERCNPNEACDCPDCKLEED